MSEILSSVSIEKEWGPLTTGIEGTLRNPLEQDGGLNSLDLSANTDIGILDNRSLLLEASFSDETNRDDTSKETSTYYSTRLLWQEMFGRHHQLSLGPMFTYSVDKGYEDGEIDENSSTIGIGPRLDYRIGNWRILSLLLFYHLNDHLQNEQYWESVGARLKIRLNIDLTEVGLTNVSMMKLEFEYKYRHYFNDEYDRHELNGSLELSWDVFDWLQFNAGCGTVFNITKRKFETSPFIGITINPVEALAVTLKLFPIESYYSSPY